MNKRKLKTIESFFKKKDKVNEVVQGQDVHVSDDPCSESELDEVAAWIAEFGTEEEEEEQEEAPSQSLHTVTGVNSEETSVLLVERDPGKHCQISDYPPEKQDQVIRAYMKHGPYRFEFKNKLYPLSGPKKHQRRFQAHWFKAFPWLEYSPKLDAAFCLPCFLFSKKPIGKVGSDVFTVKGFRTWKKVNDSDKCAFLTHQGKDGNSAHNYAVQCYDNLKNQQGHIVHVMEKQSDEDIRKNRLRLRASIDAIRWLAFQACPFRGHDESAASNNQSNFLEMVKLLASYDDEVKAVVLANAPGNTNYTSPDIQKEILDLMASNVQSAIRDEIGDAKFCLIVDESRDESRKEQMGIVVCFVDKDGFVKERFLEPTFLVLKDIATTRGSGTSASF